MSNMSQLALDYLLKRWRKATISLDVARQRSGVTDEEIMNLQTTISILEWVIKRVRAEVKKED